MYCKNLNLPNPPKHLIEECLKNIDLDIEVNRYVIKNVDAVDFSNRLDSHWKEIENKLNNKQSKLFKMPVSENLKNWLIDNLLLDTDTEMWINIFKPGDEIIPHIDGRWKTVLYYILDEANGITSWYKPKEEFRKLEHPPFGQNAQFLIERLDKVFEIKMKRFQWYLFNVEEIHGVTDINGARRAAIKIAFTDNMFDRLNS